jgi:hypothetical protein
MELQKIFNIIKAILKLYEKMQKKIVKYVRYKRSQLIEKTNQSWHSK